MKKAHIEESRKIPQGHLEATRREKALEPALQVPYTIKHDGSTNLQTRSLKESGIVQYLEVGAIGTRIQSKKKKLTPRIVGTASISSRQQKLSQGGTRAEVLLSSRNSYIPVRWGANITTSNPYLEGLSNGNDWRNCKIERQGRNRRGTKRKECPEEK